MSRFKRIHPSKEDKSKNYMKLTTNLLLILSALSASSVVAQNVTDSCGFEKIKLDPYIHKKTYTIGVHANHGLDEAYDQAVGVFSEYLTATAGQKFDPPIEFIVAPNLFTELFTAIENQEVDFFYANPGVYSCIGTQVGAAALATVIKRMEVRGRTYDLDVYGGVIAVRNDNDKINSIADLKNQIIGAGGIIDLMGGQLQIYEMEQAGMSFVNDPKQVIFTMDQAEVVRGVLSGQFDVGFVRTDQIALTQDEDGNSIDPDRFKILEPKTYVMESGELFPFLHSTEVFPEWPLAALLSVPSDVQLAVQEALVHFGLFAEVGDQRRMCLETNTAEYCNSLSPRDWVPNAPCEVTMELAERAQNAANISHIAGFRTAASYFKLGTVLKEAGFLVRDDKGNWACTRPEQLYEGISCPDGFFKRNALEFANGCKEAGLACDDQQEYECFCKPCIKAFEVDVYQIMDSDPHLLPEYYGDSYEGCEKMSICGTFEQGDSLTFRIYDNMQRVGAKVEVITHSGDSQKTLPTRDVPTSRGFAHDFTVTDKRVQIHVIEVLVDGKPISQSPIRVAVEEKDCDAVYGATSNRVPDENGDCVCAGNTYEMGGTCLDAAYFFLIIFALVFLVLGVLIFFYLGYKKKQSDSVWHINVDELHFNEPPEIIGQGGFGVVILGQYRGTKVAVKRVLPPVKDKRGNSTSSLSGSGEGSANIIGTKGSVEIGSEDAPKNKTNKKKDKSKDGKNVKFGENSGDIESATISKSGSIQLRGSISGSNRDWERLLMMGHTTDNDILRILESATASDHGSDIGAMRSATASQSVFLKILPMWMRFDEHSRRVSEFVTEMRLLSSLRHPCITTVMGAVVSNSVDPMLVMEYMEYGSLHDLLHNETMSLGGEIILQVVRDIVQGIQFLHASKPPLLHGDFKAKNILVDSRFRAKVADFGFSHFKTAKQRNILQGTPFYMAPEYLRRHSEYTPACDIYSFAMILFEIYARAGPFEGEDPRKILPKVCHPRLNKRPAIPENMPSKMTELMKKCWSANPFFRPTAKDLDYLLVEMSSKDTEPLEVANDKNHWNLKKKTTSLYDVFPKHIADALNAGKKVDAESHEIVTIVFSDIVGFTTISQNFSAMKVSTMLDRLYQAFDELAKKYHVFKVETIGDAYMGVTNLDGSEFDTHAKQCAQYAQDAIRAASQIMIDEDNPSLGFVQIRVGINSGPVVSNVIGSLNPRYGLFGDTVNTASRMESHSMPGKIHCSFGTAQLLMQQAPDIPLTFRGIIRVKGKGKMKTYWVGGDDLMASPAAAPTMATDEKVSVTDHDDDVNDHSDRPTSDRSLAKSTGTHDTAMMDVESLADSVVQDHFIKVHTEHKHLTKVNMDGAIQEVMEEDDGVELGGAMNPGSGTSNGTTNRVVDTSALNGGKNTFMRQ